MPGEVWSHFSNLKNIQMLAESTRIEIVVLDRVFDPRYRRQYIREVTQSLRQHSENPKIVFLDPDTGIEPGTAKAEHVTIKDIKEIWEALKPHDWLAIYQHAYRRKNWLETSRRKFKRACGVENVKTFLGPMIAADIAVFAAEKMPP